MLVERALVVEADRRSPRRPAPAHAATAAGHAEPDLRQVGVRRQPDGALEQADELEGRQPDLGGQILQAQLRGISACMRSFTRARSCRSTGAGGMRSPPLPWRWNSRPKLPISSSRSWNTSRPSSMAQCIAMNASIRSRSAKMLWVKYGTRSMPRPGRKLIQRSLRQIHRAVLPALAPSHPAGVRLGGIEDEQGRGRRLLDLAAALDHRAALLGHGDDQRLVDVRRIFVGREIGMHQAETGEMPVPPVLGGVPGIAAGHG